MDLELLKRFYLVAQEGTVGRAAEKLHIARSALSKSVDDFEYQMKTKLFERVPKGMQLTPQGERLFAFAKQILEQTDSFEKAFHEKEDEISGELKIMITPFSGTDWLLPKIKEFLKKHPNIKIKLILKNLKDIIIEEADVTICSAIPRAPHLIQKYLYTSYISLFSSEEYLKKFGTPKTLEDLDHHRLITYGGNIYNPYGNESWILNLGRKLGEPSRASFLEVDSLHGLIACAQLGLGIIEAPDDPAVLSHGLVRVLPEKRGPQFEVYYVFSSKRQNSKKINALYEYLAKAE